MRLLHKLAHLMGLNGCINNARIDTDGKIQHFIVCVGCGRESEHFYFPDSYWNENKKDREDLCK